MNRSGQRKQKERQGTSGLGALQPVFAQAVAHHQAGRLQQAAELYQQILTQYPGHAEALHLLGLIAYKTGHLDEAIGLISDAIKQDDTQAPYCFNLGVVLQKQGKLGEAADAYRKAVKRNSCYAEALGNLGTVLLKQSRHDQAETAYREVVKLTPNSADAHNNLGVALKEQGKLIDAIISYQEALKRNPAHVEAQNNLGVAYRDHGKLDAAIAAFTQTLALRPSYVKAHYDRAFAYLWKGDLVHALEDFTASAKMKQNHGWLIQETTVSKARMKHDAKQVSYLMERGLLGQNHAAYRDMLDQLRCQAAQEGATGWRMSVRKEEMTTVAPSFNRLLHIADCPALPGGVINPALDVATIEARYNGTKPEIVTVDHLLTDEALQAICRFCLESTIWKRDYPNGYLGAFLGDGLACPLLLQISEELRLKFPGIFKHHKLTQAWSFKQDNALTALAMHADAAAVNVNFWITPDAANLDPDHGGLIVWNRKAPREWNFEEYNDQRKEPEILAWLEQQGAETITVPYRENRALIFNSDLFHKSDQCRFRDDYESRRINLTLLYGRRGEA